MWDEIMVLSSDVTKASRVEITIICDYCGKEKKVCNKVWQNNKSKQIIKKDACSYKCRQEYTKEVSLLKYGVDNPFKDKDIQKKQKDTVVRKYGVEHISQLPEVKEKVKCTMENRYGKHYFRSEEYQSKIKKTNLERYGVEYYTKTNEYKEKAINTNLKKYGSIFPTQSKIVQDKTKTTNLERYGCENVFANEEIKKKIKEYWLKNEGVKYYSQTKDYTKKVSDTWKDKTYKERIDIINRTQQTNLKRYGKTSFTQTEEYKAKVKKTNNLKYGTDWVLQNKEIREKINKTLVKNGTLPSSRQQRYLCNLLNGHLNYYTGRSFLDIAYPDQKIYIEYNGGGHNLAVKMGEMTEDEFRKHELKRYFSLKKQGWKSIVFTSRKDRLPLDGDIMQIFIQCKEILKDNNWVEADFDECKIITKDSVKDFACTGFQRIYKGVDLCHHV